jgi:tetratricopeptide (TPR) repeat protein
MSLEDGLIAFKRGRYTDAIALLNAYCTECQATGSTGSRNYMQAGMALVKAYHADKQMNQAIAQCEAFMSSEGNPALQIWADKTFPKLQQAQQQPEPEAQPKQNLQPKAESPDALRQLESGIAAQKRGDNKAAIQSLEAYLETCNNVRSRNYMQAQISRVKAYRSLNQLDHAYRICEELHAIDNAALQSWASKAMSALQQAGASSQKTSDDAPSDEATANNIAPSLELSSSQTPTSQPSTLQPSATRSPSPVSRKPPTRPGMARMLDNTATIEISAAAGSSPLPSRSSTTNVSSHSGTSTIGSYSATGGRSRQTTRAHVSRSKTPAATGTGAAALLGGGLLVFFTKPRYRRGLFAVIGLTFALGRACVGGGLSTGDTSIADESYVDYSANALHEAACNGDAQEAQALIQQGTSVNIIDSEGNTPLFLAVSGCSSSYDTYPVTDGHREVMTLLMNHGASTSVTNNYGQTPLHWAAAWGPADVTTTLISSGATIGAMDAYQDTPLHWAAWTGNDASVEALVGLGVPLNPINSDGATPLDVAREYGSYSTAELLQSQGATAALSH